MTLDHPEMSSAVRKFLDDVTDAFKPQNLDENVGPLEAEQWQYMLASSSVAALLEEVGHKDAAVKFRLLAAAFHDVAEGSRHRLFLVEKPIKRGAQLDSTDVWHVRAQLCIGLQLFASGANETGKRAAKEAAIKFAMKHRHKFERVLRPGAEFETSVRTWLKKFATDEVENELALQNYKAGMKRLATETGNSSREQKRQAGERLIALVAERASALSPPRNPSEL